MDFDENDTIAAVSTPLGSGGISIIRISGPDCFNVTERVFVRADKVPFSKQKSNEIHYGHVINEKGEVIDEVLVSKFVHPKTYTTQDTAEINCHGGVISAKEVLALVIKNGARLAEPGEFTKRAFLNGRIDLIQAQAVNDVIEAKTAQSLKAGQLGLSGVISDKINEIKELILSLTVSLEVTIEYPEYDVPQLTNDEITNKLSHIRSLLLSLYEAYKMGDILKEGVNVAICGKPNVGKSTLLNTLSNKQRAIVTDIPGTTRDVVYEYLNVAGIPIKLMDTAGIRDSEDTVEAIGVSRSIDAVNEADICLFVYDATQAADEEDLRIFNLIRDKKHIVVLNKSDMLKSTEPEELKQNFIKNFTTDLNKEKILVISAVDKLGVEEIFTELTNFITSQNADFASEAMIVNTRHKQLLYNAVKSIESAIHLIDDGLFVDFVETDIMQAQDFLCEITGETLGETVIDEIFKNFCLGK